MRSSARAALLFIMAAALLMLLSNLSIVSKQSKSEGGVSTVRSIQLEIQIPFAGEEGAVDEDLQGIQENSVLASPSLLDDSEEEEESDKAFLDSVDTKGEESEGFEEQNEQVDLEEDQTEEKVVANGKKPTKQASSNKNKRKVPSLLSNPQENALAKEKIRSFLASKSKDAKKPSTSAFSSQTPVLQVPDSTTSTSRQTPAQAMAKEFNLTLSQDKFTTLEELNSLQQGMCPPLRHCSAKTNQKLSLRGGRWVDSVFHPFDCWFHVFNLDEIQSMNNPDGEAADGKTWRNQVVVLLDDNSIPATTVNKLPSQVFRIATGVPESLAQHEEVVDAIRTLLRNAKKSVNVTLVATWSTNTPKLMLHRLVALAVSLPVTQVNVAWLSRPFSDKETASEAIAVNTKVYNTIETILRSKSHSVMLPLAVKSRASEPSKMVGTAAMLDSHLTPELSDQPKRTLPLAVPASMFGSKLFLSEFYLMDIRGENAFSRSRPTSASTFVDKHASIRTNLRVLKKNWIPAVHPDAFILVVCDLGIDSRRAAEILRQRGFKNAISLKLGLQMKRLMIEEYGGLDVLGRKKEELHEDIQQQGGMLDLSVTDTEGGSEVEEEARQTSNIQGTVEPNLPLFDEAKGIFPKKMPPRLTFTGLDLFTPTLTMPEHVVKPDANALLTKYIANAILNVAYQNSLQQAARIKGEGHPCSNGRCTSCFATHSEIPSTRVTRKVMEQFILPSKVPALISLPDTLKLCNITEWQNLQSDWNGKRLVTVYRANQQPDLQVSGSKRLDELIEKRISPRGMTNKRTNVKPSGEDSERGSVEDDEQDMSTGDSGMSQQQQQSPKPIFGFLDILSNQAMRSFGIQNPSWLGNGQVQSTLWLSSGQGGFLPLHKDDTTSTGNTFVAMVIGSQQWHFFLPRGKTWLYSKPNPSSQTSWSRIQNPANFRPWMLKRFPMFRLAIANSLKVEVKEHQVLVAPTGVHRAVYSLEDPFLAAKFRTLSPP